MSNLVYRISTNLCHTLESIPVGTNPGLYSLSWSKLSGNLIRSYGAVTPALLSFGLKRKKIQKLLEVSEQIREKKCVHGHLLKGVLGHRRQRTSVEPEPARQAA